MAKKPTQPDKSDTPDGGKTDPHVTGMEGSGITASSSPQELPAAIQRDASDEALQQALAEIRQLAVTLETTVQEARAQSTRTEMLRNAVRDAREDVRAAAQSVMTPPPASAAYVDPHGVESHGKCGPCACVSDGCCCFDIKIWQVRATSPQSELGDTGELTLPIPTINALEMQMYFTVDDTGFLWPGLASTVDLRVEGGVNPGPGGWTVVNQTVKRVCLPKGKTVTKDLWARAREHDEGAERLAGFKDEYGEAMGSITLDCCMEKIYPPMPIDINLNMGGRAGGSVQVAYYAERVCC